MTILHMNIDDDDDDDDDDDEDDSPMFATKTSTNQKKQIPHWARSKSPRAAAAEETNHVRRHISMCCDS